MEESRLEDLIVDSIWQIIFLQTNFFNKKATLINYLYGEIVKNNEPKEPTLSTQAKLILLENNLIKPMSACKQASLKCVTENKTATNTKIGDLALNEKGFARLSVLSNINSNIMYSPKGNKNIYLALANALKEFTLSGTPFFGKGLFEVFVDYFKKHPVLESGTPSTTANSFFTNIEMQKIVDKFNKSYNFYVDTLLIKFKSELKQQKSDAFSIYVIDDIKREVEASFNMFSSNYNSVIAENIPKKILEKYSQQNWLLVFFDIIWHFFAID